MIKHSVAIWLALATWAVAAAAGAQPASGRLTCRVTENGKAAAGTMTAHRGSQRIDQRSCGTPLELAPGDYLVTLRLDGALDQPTKTQRVTVTSGRTSSVAANFETATLEVRVSADDKRAAGMAAIFKDGRRIGSVGSGVPAHLGTGSYEVRVRYRGQEQRFSEVALVRGEHRILSADF